MLNLYIKIALRYLRKNRLYSIINVTGLTIGIATFLLIMAYVNYEKNYDTFEGSDNIYRVYMDYLEGETMVPGDAQSYNLIGPTLKKEFPEVLDFVRLRRYEKVTFAWNEKVIEEKSGGLADPSYFDIFDYPIQLGDQKTALESPNSLVLTESFSKKLFGDNNPIGQVVKAYYNEEETSLKVTGVTSDPRPNTHIGMNFLISFSTFKTWGTGNNERELNWNLNTYYTYLRIDKNADRELLKTKVIQSDFHGDRDERHNLESLHSIHLNSNKPYEAEVNGNSTRVNFLGSIAFIILILSWLNYINLATTKSLERAKEIGIRKVVGAQKPHLIIQFILESVLLNVIAICLALLVCYLVFPLFTSFVGKQLVFDSVLIKSLLPQGIFILLGIFLASLYPAFILSSYNPIKALKGKIRTTKTELGTRKVLVISQFLATIILISSTILINKQINYLRDQPLGVDLNQVIALQGEVLEQTSDSLKRHALNSLSNELTNLTYVEEVSAATTYPGDGYDNLSSFVGMTYPNGIENSNTVFYGNQVDDNYFSTLDIQFLAGQSFPKPTNNSGRNIVVNESFVKELGYPSAKEILGEVVTYWGVKWTICGVMKNYHHFGLNNKTQPMIIRPGIVRDNLLVKLNHEATSQSGISSALSGIKKSWSRIFPRSTFNYTFLDAKFQQQYEADTKFGKSFKLFTFLAIFIASLGLFAMTSYICLQRKKEIGIRKISGASVLKIMTLLNMQFIKWIGVALIIGIPICWYGMNYWLENFAVRTSINWWIFLLAGLGTLGITALTVSWKSFQAAANNPIDSIRNE